MSWGYGMIDNSEDWKDPNLGSGVHGGVPISQILSLFLALVFCLCLLSLSELTHSRWGWKVGP